MSGEAALVPFLGAINQVTHPTPQPRTTKRAFSFRESLLIVSFAVSEAMPIALRACRIDRPKKGTGGGPSARAPLPRVNHGTQRSTNAWHHSRALLARMHRTRTAVRVALRSHNPEVVLLLKPTDLIPIRGTRSISAPRVQQPVHITLAAR